MGFWKIFLIVLAILLVIGAAAGIYFYYFYTYATFSLCIKNQEINTGIACTTTAECQAILLNSSAELSNSIKQVPDFAKATMDEAFNEMIYCKNSCITRGIYNVGVERGKGTNNCEAGDKRIFININGQKGIGLLGYLNKINQTNH